MSSLVEHIAVKVIDNAERFIGPRFEQAKRNLAVVERWLQQHANRLQHVRPKGGVTVFAALPGVRDVDAFCTELIAARSVLLCPGSCFGRPQFVRIGFGGSSADLQVGLERLSVHMDECGI
jgi:aspartate/methionine/tyrosine aminotransferase